MSVEHFLQVFYNMQVRYNIATCDEEDNCSAWCGVAQDVCGCPDKQGWPLQAVCVCRPGSEDPHPIGAIGFFSSSVVPIFVGCCVGQVA